MRALSPFNNDDVIVTTLSAYVGAEEGENARLGVDSLVVRNAVFSMHIVAVLGTSQPNRNLWVW